MIFALILLILFHQSFCQGAIQEDIANACPTNKSVDAINEYCQTTYIKIGRLERKVGNILDLLTSIRFSFGCTVCRSGYEYYPQELFCYKFHTDCKTWSEARQVCQQEGGDLISLNDRNILFFRELSRAKSGNCNNVWVGAKDFSTVAVWSWVNGDWVSQTLWAVEKPSYLDGIEKCADLSKTCDYGLSGEDCSWKQHFICQAAYTIN